MDQKPCSDLAAWQSHLASGVAVSGHAAAVSNARPWVKSGTALYDVHHVDQCKETAPRALRNTATLRFRGEIKALACLCLFLGLWRSNIPNMLAEALGRSVIWRHRSKEPTSDQTLRFTKDGTFHISVFEDLHFAEDASKDNLTKGVMRNVLSKENPQLVVINGDLISGEATQASNSSKYLDQVVSPLVDEGYLWASTYGNHDSNPNLDPRKDIYDQEKRYKNSLTQSLVSDSDAGVTNYYLPVFSHSGSESDIPTLLLWFFDSKGGQEPTDRVSRRDSNTRPDWVDQSVVDWFTATNANLQDKYGKVVPSLAFYHIPADAMRAYQDDGVDSHTAPGINGETVVQQGSGDTDYTGQDKNFMKALLNTSGLLATFSGHDHDNDWCFKWDGETVAQNLSGNGLSMCYGRHTGYGGYGNAKRGGRQIMLNEETLHDEVETWIRLEDGTISAHVTLNGTYGHDKYSSVSQKATRSFETRSGGMPKMHPADSLLFLMYLWLPILLIWRWKM